MSGDLVPRPADAAAVRPDGDNRYKEVQAKLRKLAAAMDDATIGLEELERSMRNNASRARGVAQDIENADLDPRFVRMTGLVASALGGAGYQVRKLRRTAQETADLAHRTRRRHSKLYGALDTIRSNRREKTPKPGFFNR